VKSEEREDDTHIPESPTEADETPDEGDAPTTPSPDPDPDRSKESPADDAGNDYPVTQAGGPGQSAGPS
jgi:hypothetical protein